MCGLFGSEVHHAIFMVITYMLQTMKRQWWSVRPPLPCTAPPMDHTNRAAPHVDHAKQIVLHIDRCTTLPDEDGELARSNICTIALAMGRIVHLRKHLSGKWSKLPPVQFGEHLGHCIYQDKECVSFRSDSPTSLRAHACHAEALERGMMLQGPEFCTQVLWRAFRMALEYIYWEPAARVRNAQRLNQFFKQVMEGRQRASDWSKCEMPLLSSLGPILFLVSLVLENAMHGPEHSFYWDMLKAPQYLGEWFPRLKLPDGSEAVAPHRLDKEVGWFANTLNYNFGSHEADPMGLLHDFLVSYHDTRRRVALARAREAYAALSVGLKCEYGMQRWKELYGEPPTSGEVGYLIPLGRSVFEMQWEDYALEPALPEPDWHVLESLCESILLPPSGLFDALQTGTLKKENLRVYLEGTREFICHTLYEPKQTLVRMADFLADAGQRLRAMARLAAEGLPMERVCLGCDAARTLLEAWRQSVEPAPHAHPSPTPLPATPAKPAGPLDTVDRLACALPEAARVACSREVTPPGAAPHAPHPARVATAKKRRALSMQECVVVK